MLAAHSSRLLKSLWMGALLSLQCPVSPSLMSHMNVLRGHSAPPPRSLMKMLDRAAPASSPEELCLARAVSWTLILWAGRSSQFSTSFFLLHPFGPQSPAWIQLRYVKSISLCGGWEDSEHTFQSAPLLHTKVQTEMETITCVTSWEFLLSPILLQQLIPSVHLFPIISTEGIPARPFNTSFSCY